MDLVIAFVVCNRPPLGIERIIKTSPHPSLLRRGFEKQSPLTEWPQPVENPEKGFDGTAPENL